MLTGPLHCAGTTKSNIPNSGSRKITWVRKNLAKHISKNNMHGDSGFYDIYSMFMRH